MGVLNLNSHRYTRYKVVAMVTWCVDCGMIFHVLVDYITFSL